VRLLESSHDFKSMLVAVSYASYHAGDLFVSIALPTNQGSQRFSMTVAKADDVAVTTNPLKFEVYPQYIERLRQWIEANDNVPLNNFIRMFKEDEDGTILSSKKFRNFKFRAQSMAQFMYQY
jgi:hypothetical protein